MTQQRYIYNKSGLLLWYEFIVAHEGGVCDKYGKQFPDVLIGRVRRIGNNADCEWYLPAER